MEDADFKCKSCGYEVELLDNYDTVFDGKCVKYDVVHSCEGWGSSKDYTSGITWEYGYCDDCVEVEDFGVSWR